MLQSVEGVYRDGKIELVEPAPEGAEGKVIVTFLAVGELNLADHGIDDAQAALARANMIRVFLRFSPSLESGLALP